MVGEGFRGPGIDLERGPHQPVGFLEAIALRLDQPEKMQRLEMMWVRGQDRFVERLGLRQLAALMRGHGLAELGRNVVSVRFHLNVSRSPEGWATATYRAARGQNRAAPLPTSTF